MTTTWTDVVTPGHVGPELITNGSFSGNLNGWTVQNVGAPGWQYGSNSAEHISQGANSDFIYQNLNLPGGTFRITITIGGSNGTVYVYLGTLSGGSGQIYNAGVETVTFDTAANSGSGLFIQANPTSTGFDGTITDISVKNLNLVSWTSVAAPSPITWTNITNPTPVTPAVAGSPIGLLLSLTYALSIGGIWTKVAKAT